jgi:putative spermidine/putrescine transport system permease protein
MAVASSGTDIVQTVDGVPLRLKLRRAERMRKYKAMGLILPLFVFLLLAFIVPIGALLFISVENPEVPTVLPRTAQAILDWDEKGLPGNDVLVPFIEELKIAQEKRIIGKPAKRLNYNITGYRSLMLKTGRRIVGKKRTAVAVPATGTLGVTGDTDSGKGVETVEAVVVNADAENLIDTFIGIDKRWGERKYWLALKDAAGSYTAYYMLAALDRKTDTDGNVVLVPERRQIYVDVIYRTFWISLVVTVICFVMGYPLAYLLATVPTRYGNMLMILVLLPFWTSLLVRTTAWVVLLQREGVLNDAAMSAGLFGERIQLIHNRFGVYVAMVHILLPFMVLPIFSVMKGISPTYMRAAASLGANPFRSFMKVYVPQTIPGIGAGCLLVFIISLGYYITPALVGGAADQMLSYFIAFFTNRTINWGMSSALSVILLACVLVMFWIYNRLVGIDKMKMG